MITLYYSKSVCSLAPHILLREAGLKFNLEPVNLRTKIMANEGNYLDVNPKGSVPALKLDNGDVLTEVPAVLQWIAEQSPERELMPTVGTFERFRALEWLNYVGTEVHKTFSNVVMAGVWLKNAEGRDELKASTQMRLAGKFKYLDAHLANHKYLLGEKFSAPDTYLFTVVRWGDHFHVDYHGFPNLVRFMNEMAQRPSVLEALKAEG